MFVLKYLVVYVFIQVVVTGNRRITAENQEDNDEIPNDIPESNEVLNNNEEDDSEPAVEYDSNDDENDNSDLEDIANNEPFDPEKNGFLLHEYYNKVYAKYPDYDTSMMKQNLIYLGDVLLSDKEKDVLPEEVETVGDQFELDPREKELFIKGDETEKEDEVKQPENEAKTADTDAGPNNTDDPEDNEYDWAADT